MVLMPLLNFFINRRHSLIYLCFLREDHATRRSHFHYFNCPFAVTWSLLKVDRMDIIAVGFHLCINIRGILSEWALRFAIALEEKPYVRNISWIIKYIMVYAETMYEITSELPRRGYASDEWRVVPRLFILYELRLSS